MSKTWRYAKKFPASAAGKHFGKSEGEAIAATLGRKNIPHTNSVIDPTSHYESGGSHYVSGQSWNVLAGPRKNGQLAFVTVQARGHQVDKFKTTDPGHREGPANAITRYVPKPTSIALRHRSTDPDNFGEDT
ncbi:hypothetical protein KK141_11000 [Dyella sp. LX-66]|uniref:hypothetical protein n=1 Tax=unclassified Dyella TaxID=2634549 RepID=UPI001BE0CFB5|nr:MULTISPECIES: hypothetical protein [unclassified Dyella]MBT2118582.1 hypothetical protein [Dyella sp. LX-1]MBT2140059.1 hypothetical protein [Dyella sp. LX-66]